MNDFDRALIAFFGSERARPVPEAVADRVIDDLAVAGGD